MIIALSPMFSPDTPSRRTRIESIAHLAGLVTWSSAGPALAVSGDSESYVNAAVPLFVLGVLALLMGLRNLRALRHKPLAPQFRRRPAPGQLAEASEED